MKILFKSKKDYKSIFLCFVHIERAGGTTMHSMFQNSSPTYVSLKTWCNRQDKRNILSPKKLEFMLQVLPFTSGIGGHSTRYNLDYLDVVSSGRELFFLTFLREPVARYMSHYNYQKLIMGIDWDLKNFLADKHFSNFQTKRIAGEENLEKAIEILTKGFSFVGLTGRFDESLVLLKRYLLGLDIRYEKRNELRQNIDVMKYNDLSEVERQKIEHANELDMKLYDHVKNVIYNDSVTEYGIELDEDVRKFKRSNEKYKYPRGRHIILMGYKALFRYLIEPAMHRFDTNYS